MTLMVGARRGFGLFLAIALAIPALSLPFFRLRAVSDAENRPLASAPAWPTTPAGWTRWPREVDAFLADHFGFRERLVALGNRTFGRVGKEGRDAVAPPVLDGGHGRLFLVEGLLSSTGHEVDREGAADYSAFVCDAAQRARRDGVRLVFAIAPSPADIYPEDAPEIARPVRSPTNYDLIMTGVGGCGVPAADLRPALRAAKGSGNLYRRTDTHWTALGAMIGYNQLVATLGRPGWKIAPSSARWAASANLTDGDLPRLGARPPVPETVMFPDRAFPPPSIRRRPLTGFQFKPDRPPYVLESDKDGATVVIVGDSFTQHFFPPYFAPFVHRVVWIHQEDCRFDWNIVRSLRPDYLVLMPTERYARCPGKGRPQNY